MNFRNLILIGTACASLSACRHDEDKTATATQTTTTTTSTVVVPAVTPEEHARKTEALDNGAIGSSMVNTPVPNNPYAGEAQKP